MKRASLLVGFWAGALILLVCLVHWMAGREAVAAASEVRPLPSAGESQAAQQQVEAIAGFIGHSDQGAGGPGYYGYAPVADFGLFDTTFYVQNPAASQTIITLMLRDSSGNLVYQTTDALSARGSKGYDLSNLGVIPAGQAGSVAVFAVEPVYVTAVAKSTSNKLLMSYGTAGSGAVEAVLSAVVKDYFGANSTIYVQNTGNASTAITVTFDALNASGLDYVANATLTANGTAIYDQSAMPALGSEFMGWARVAAEGPVAVVAFVTYSSNSGGAYNGIDADAAGANFWMPRQNKNYMTDWLSYFEAVNVSSQSGDITTTWHSSAGGVFRSETRNIAAGFPQYYLLATMGALPSGMDGALMATADEPVVALSHLLNSDAAEDGIALSPAIGPGQAGTTVYVPRAVRVDAAGMNTILSVQNTGGSQIAVTTTLYHQSGSLAAVVQDTISSDGFARYDLSSVAGLSSSFQGAAVVVAGGPVAVEALLIQRSQDTDVFMPVVLKRWPPIPDVPALNRIDNPGSDEDYQVTWGAALLADTYELQEDDNNSFTSPATRYSGTGTTKWFYNQAVGTWHYRVRACNSYGCSGWSNIRGVIVLPPSCNLTISNGTGGTLCYEVYGSGIGNKCFPPGDHLYGSFPSGTYNWGASGCGTSTGGNDYYPPGDYEHEFWCSVAAWNDQDSAVRGQLSEVGRRPEAR